MQVKLKARGDFNVFKGYVKGEKSRDSEKRCPARFALSFNADGNEKISPLNRTYQNGPVNGGGQV